jgi:hypothetical protein
MAKTALILTGAALGAFVGLAAFLGATAGPADAGYGVDEVAPKTMSNSASKGDMAAVSHKAPKAMEVAHIEKIGDELTLRDSKGRVVYRSNTGTQTTTVEKNVDVPLLTGYGVAVGRVDAAFQATSN